MRGSPWDSEFGCASAAQARKIAASKTAISARKDRGSLSVSGRGVSRFCRRDLEGEFLAGANVLDQAGEIGVPFANLFAGFGEFRFLALGKADDGPAALLYDIEIALG